MSNNRSQQPRSRLEVPQADQWDLSTLYPTPDAWEKDFEKLKSYLSLISGFKGTLGKEKSQFKAALDFSTEWDQLSEKLGDYAHLKTAEDVADSSANDRMGRFMGIQTQAAGLFSFMTPEIQALEATYFQSCLDDPLFVNDKISLMKIRRFKPHVLGEEAERVLALGSEARSSLQKSFSSLTNADLDFGTVQVDGQDLSLTQSTFSVFLQNPDPLVRKAAYHQFYDVYQKHENTLASLYAGSILQDVASARSRNYHSSRQKSLFADDVPESVYDSLITAVRSSFPILHRYYDLRRKSLKLEKLHHSDVYAPLVPGTESHHTYEEASDLVYRAVAPLGKEYADTLREGLLNGWVDRYENKGKRSGAFSSGSYSGPPYILMNYKEDSLRDVFTLAHEGGHSMHSWYSARNNPFQHYGYTIFEAEVASTFNEQLLAKLLLEESADSKIKAMILSKLIEDTVATLFRQTMFAEFEHLVHAHSEAGGGLTLEYFKTTYKKLLEEYFGPAMVFEENSALEGLRIPHFYSAFYVYKYATGISAAMALSDKVLNGGEKERTDYLNFLKSGGSKYPLESLKLAGVDLSTPEPVLRAIQVFEKRLDELEKLLGL